ncbi:MAG: hypothetical protein R2736_21905 [Solirubrobacterales bacterium]
MARSAFSDATALPGAELPFAAAHGAVDRRSAAVAFLREQRSAPAGG